MRLFLSSLLILSFLFSNSQDTVRIKHTEYTTVFSKSLKYPVLVQWWTTKAKVSCAVPLKRVDSFGLFDDGSEFDFNNWGSISLNVLARRCPVG
jgi:hypothetical protein